MWCLVFCWNDDVVMYSYCFIRRENANGEPLIKVDSNWQNL